MFSSPSSMPLTLPGTRWALDKQLLRRREVDLWGTREFLNVSQDCSATLVNTSCWRCLTAEGLKNGGRTLLERNAISYQRTDTSFLKLM